jgi:hypothetical protein
LIATNAKKLASFGAAVSLGCEALSVGSPGGMTFNSASAYLFLRGNNGWTEVGSATGSVYDPGQDTGRTISLFGNSFASGATGINSTGQVYVHSFGATTSYCTAKLNSCGTTPAMDGHGLARATSGCPFEVSVSNVKASKPALLLYSDAGPHNQPFQGGTLCISPPIKRAVSVFAQGGTQGCDAVASVDMNAFAAGLLGGHPLPSLKVAGTQVCCQFWGRDAPGESMVSNALKYIVYP